MGIFVVNSSGPLSGPPVSPDKVGDKGSGRGACFRGNRSGLEMVHPLGCDSEESRSGTLRAPDVPGACDSRCCGRGAGLPTRSAVPVCGRSPPAAHEPSPRSPRRQGGLAFRPVGSATSSPPVATAWRISAHESQRFLAAMRLRDQVRIHTLAACERGRLECPGCRTTPAGDQSCSEP
jgi:hypothetical protein